MTTRTGESRVNMAKYTMHSLFIALHERVYYKRGIEIKKIYPDWLYDFYNCKQSDVVPEEVIVASEHRVFKSNYPHLSFAEIKRKKIFLVIVWICDEYTYLQRNFNLGLVDDVVVRSISRSSSSRGQVSRDLKCDDSFKDFLSRERVMNTICLFNYWNGLKFTDFLETFNQEPLKGIKITFCEYHSKEM